jgi:hypothetical protein
MLKSLLGMRADEEGYCNTELKANTRSVADGFNRYTDSSVSENRLSQQICMMWSAAYKG